MLLVTGICLQAARKVFPLHTLVGPNCASGQPERWTKRLDDLVDVVALSRYPSEPEQMIDGIFGNQGYKRFGKPIWFGEFPVWGAQYVTEALRLSERAYVYNWRSWWQDQDRHWTDGLLQLDGTPSWRMGVFTQAAKELEMATTAELEAKIKLLEEQQSLTVDLAARILSGKWDEGVESAEALLRGISPKYGSFEAVKFPSP